MALGLPQSGGGNRVPIIKYDARAGRIFRVDRTQNAGGQYDSATVEITPNFQAVFDLANDRAGVAVLPGERRAGHGDGAFWPAASGPAFGGSSERLPGLS